MSRQSPYPPELRRRAVRMVDEVRDQYDTVGYPGFVLTLLDGYTGARWSELIAQKPGHYDRAGRRFPVRRPIREAAGKIEEAPRPKSPAGRRWIQLPPFLADLYQPVVDGCPHVRVFTGARGS
ncbi:MAG TPA: hypothetical protein VNW94_27880, partial [Streptosporangiaceae bacterium]|nr:hypothetical protein [Streptosporangiaceae bacterium]